jgi:NADPH-dependent 2,4-dienoyl-CoA reductase/sulfur reductase-like enzyme
MFRERFNIEVHTNTDVISIDRPSRTMSVRDLLTAKSRTERYDALVLLPGAAPIRPPPPGVDLPAGTFPAGPCGPGAPTPPGGPCGPSLPGTPCSP